MKQGLVERRQFLKKLGLGAAGVSAVAVMAGGLSQAKQGGAVAKEEIDKLARKYDKLDRRSKLMMRGMFVLLGIDVLLLI
ncbi:MAG TPA: hypothetical protein EYQ44_04840 [Porticoccaceae bacterium]|nr:hypothetical protein [Porticoccaceae bacterium]HIG67137.1 hypothetical protein [Porticoccaceae bacterium]HIK81215.1 hypothetical protein [Porticoccaceae bacterium]